jgi:hypothetical protein
MRYLLDTNSLNTHLLQRSVEGGNVFVLKEVEDERTMYGSSPSNLRGVNILEPTIKHLRRLQQLLVVEGDNFELIRLYTGEGTADVAMLAYVLAEREQPESLFPEEYIIITQDKAVLEAAGRYGISCQSTL